MEKAETAGIILPGQITKERALEIIWLNNKIMR